MRQAPWLLQMVSEKVSRVNAQTTAIAAGAARRSGGKAKAAVAVVWSLGVFLLNESHRGFCIATGSARCNGRDGFRLDRCDA
jgi:hypothetical protein